MFFIFNTVIYGKKGDRALTAINSEERAAFSMGQSQQ